MTTPIAYIVTDDSGLVTCERSTVATDYIIIKAHSGEHKPNGTCINPKPVEIRLPLERECEACGGNGRIQFEHCTCITPHSGPCFDVCSACNGTGEETAGIVWRIAPGVHESLGAITLDGTTIGFIWSRVTA